MNGFLRGLLAFLIGAAGVSLGFYGALSELRGHFFPGLIALLFGLLALASAFRVSPND